MADQTEEEKKPGDTQEVMVSTTKITTGKIRYFGKISWATPTILSKVNKGVRAFCLAMIGTITGSDLFTLHEIKIIAFCLAVIAGITYGIDAAVGVEPDRQPYSAPRDQELNK